MTFQEALQRITGLDTAAMSKAQARWDQIAKPLGSLGLLEEMLVRVAGITGSAQLALHPRAVAVFCADNGVVAQGVTQCGSEVTAQMADQFARGTTTVCHMARTAGAQVFPVDVGVAGLVTEPGVRRRRIANGTCDFSREPAMTRAQALQSLEVGVETACWLAQKGYRLLITGEMGIGNTTTSSAILSVLLGKSPREVTGRGAGLSAEGLERKIQVIEQAILHHAPDPADPLNLLAKLGGFDIGAMAGLLLGGAALRIPVLLDGLISCTAALLAVGLCPPLRPYLLASHCSGEPAGQLALAALGLRAPLHADMRLGEGTGAVAVLPVLDMACAVYEGMNTFSQLDINQYQPL